MTQTQHFTGAATYTVPTGITRIRPVVAGGVGDPATIGSSKPGRGAILSALLATTPGATFAVGAGQIAGGVRGYGGASTRYYGGKGGNGSYFGDIYAGAGSGAAGSVDGADAGAPGVDAPNGLAGGGTAAGGGKVDGSGGTAGTNPGWGDGTAGQSHAAGGKGGNGATTTLEAIPASGGGAGFGGGGGGGVAGSGAGGSSSGGAAGATLTGYNTGAPYVDVYCASTPLVPTLITPIGNAWADRTRPIRLTFQHNGASADSLDGQSDAEVQHRKVGAGTWTTVTVLGTATSYDIPAGTYADGDQVEWQARTYADGLVGPWSTSDYFTAANPPATPAITTPTSGATIGTAVVAIAWTHAGQVAYQARVVNDVGGSVPAQPIIYADSGPVTSAAQNATLTVKVNSVDAHVQVRVRDIPGGLWSQWADVPVPISWQPPPTPAVYQRPDPEHGSIVMVIANPAPTGTQPAPAVNRVYVTEGGIESRRAVIAPGTDYEYWTPVGEVGVRVEAVDESTGVLSSTEVVW